MSSGCFWLVNPDVIGLFDRVPIGTRVVVRQAPEMYRRDHLGTPMAATRPEDSADWVGGLLEPEIHLTFTDVYRSVGWP